MQKKISWPISTETIEEVKLAKITLAENESENKCSSCTVYIALMTVVFTTYFFFLQLVFD